MTVHERLEKSGTRGDFERQAAKMEAAVKAMMERQVAADALPAEARATSTRKRLSRVAAQIRQWLAEHPADRQGRKGSTRLSNRTDNESAKMTTGKGVIQGYTGVAAWMTKPRSPSTPRPMAPARSRNCCSPWSMPPPSVARPPRHAPTR